MCVPPSTNKYDRLFGIADSKLCRACLIVELSGIIVPVKASKSFPVFPTILRNEFNSILSVFDITPASEIVAAGIMVSNPEDELTDTAFVASVWVRSVTAGLSPLTVFIASYRLIESLYRATPPKYAKLLFFLDIFRGNQYCLILSIVNMLFNSVYIYNLFQITKSYCLNIVPDKFEISSGGINSFTSYPTSLP